MSEIFNRVEAEIKEAMKAKNADRLSALRMMKSALANKQIENREKFEELPLDDDYAFLCGHGPGSTIGAERAGNPFLR